ncbi:MAG TPA: penicillin-binding transpeptidase domain-containing protein [Gaiellaceae bacterium]|nr:penicillin-binding transpeptidase domain-containing protein [Gaiellaceae bacterium]
MRLRWLWRLPFGRRWDYETTAVLRYEGGGWRPLWSPRLVNSRLRVGEVLAFAWKQPPRAPILGAGGVPIVAAQPVVNVGIEPRRVRDLPLLLRQLHASLGVAVGPLRTAVRAAAPTAFVPVITLRRPQYEQLRSKIYPLPGTVFSVGQLTLAPTPAFAASLLGAVGQATAEVVSASHGRVVPGESVGLSGLEQAYDSWLAGTPALVVRAVHSNGHGGTQTLYSVASTPGRSLHTTLEVQAQEAADRALAGVKQPSALVAVRISNGNVIAVSVGPDPAAYNIALEGEYPPGSTFKVATTLALLERGEQPTDTVNCPAEITVDGKQFRNAEHEVLGMTSFAQDFAHSCNTAFISLAPRVGGGALPAAARALGIGRSLDFGVPAFAGSVPVPANPVDLAAQAFGQGRDLVSPLTLAAAAAAIARGRWVAPRLVLDPVLPATPDGPVLPAGVVATLRALMRAVVTEGTGTALAGQPGLPVYGKTGTAEIGSQTPPRTDAWFIGFQGDIAFAALVSNTVNGYGGTVAAPIIARFLAQLGTG